MAFSWLKVATSAFSSCSDGAHLDLLPEHGVLLAELGLHLGETLELVGELESGEDGVLAGQRDQGRRRQRLVRVQPRHREPGGENI